MANDASPIETLRISTKDKQKLVEYIEQTSRKTVDNDRRNLRVDFHGRKVLVEITNNHGQRVQHTVLPRNLSRRGLAFVHGRFVYPESRCKVTLPMQNGKWTSVEGCIRNCRHVTGIIHEISIVFDEALDLTDFVRLTASQQERHRTEKSQDMDPDNDLDANTVGRALVIDDMATDRKLYKLWLSKLNMASNEASGVTTTLEQMGHSQFDLIMINLELGEESGVELLMHIRGGGYERPIIATSAIENDEVRKMALASGATDMLTKPFTIEQLRDMVEDMLSINTDTSVNNKSIYSSMADEEDMLPLIEEFVANLAPLSNKLRRANADSDMKLLVNICQSLKGAGDGYGFEAVTSTARYALDMMDSAQKDTDTIRKAVNELVQTLRRIKPGRPANTE